MKIPCPSPNSMKIKTLIQSHIFPPFYHVVRAITKAKSMVVHLVNKTKNSYSKKERRKKKNSLYSSFRLHYNWSSSHVIPMPEPTAYYDSTWDSSVFMAEEAGDNDEGIEPPLSRYLHWLEEKLPEDSEADMAVEEIDRLADMFIASCHEKFRLEKQESYRRYQEMLARST
ncbi:uncharacterized protein LOC131220967 [Magnolia sinica]|uniref:uncharacterized protein LOC131220967 n=1 Tax=Magnolia sinica TaxID=86752 RepID=UPI00265A2615|nr:uncharacterized protein LOC131220967 [Magnolia sinica]